MVRPSTIAASALTTNATQPRPPQPPRTRASGSFHAGEPFPQLSPYDEALPGSSRTRRSSAGSARRLLRRQSTAKYHTFPTAPPAAPHEHRRLAHKPPGWYQRVFGSQEEEPEAEERGTDTDDTSQHTELFGGTERRRKRRRSLGIDLNEDARSAATTPLPWTQLGLLALLSLAEQTALNSIGPYLPTMVASFNEIPAGQEGVYVGLLASAFALAQLATNLLWGYLSDRVGRKPTMLIGTALLMGCFLCFGFCTTYAQLIMVHIAMGLLNGNAAIVPTCLGEITDRTNQSSAFTWLPVIYSLGSITGPALGGLLVGAAGGAKYPFLAPNILVAGLLLASVVVLAVWFEETLDSLDHVSAGAGPEWINNVVRWCEDRWHRLRGHPGKGADDRRTSGAEHDPEETSDISEDEQLLGPHADTEEEDDDIKKSSGANSAFQGPRNRNTIAVLGTYLVFQLANISFNSLYPIFASSPPPTGRELGPGRIGLSMSLAGLATIAFQLSVFQRLKARMGNLGTYRYSLLGMAISMALMPWVGYMDGKPLFGLGNGKGWLYAELGVTLVLKNICAVGGLSSVMLLITNSAPSHETLGTLNGIAQTLSAAGRSIGPFLSGGLFTLSTRVRPKGEALAWGLFAGITLIGWLGSYAIRNKGLESAEWEEDDSDRGYDSEAGDV
ncbi:hypothetical protein N0V88_003350 [Collariella sp. IMI 366227]|nr:hypothetical protein N0V88_003350 [Collariella sp. IMI 366227]